MDLASVWKQYLSNWPRSLVRKGVVVTADEQIVFVSFLMSEAVVMFERQAPDSMGGRKVIMPYSEIKAIKVTEPVNDDPFVESGFAPSLKAPKQVSTTPAISNPLSQQRQTPVAPQKV